MQIALYIKDGLEQLVLTPDTDTEKNILAKIHNKSREMSILRGSFYECRGGWVRQSGADDDSTMIVLREKKVEAPLPEGSIPYDASVDPSVYTNPNAD